MGDGCAEVHDTGKTKDSCDPIVPVEGDDEDNVEGLRKKVNTFS